MRSEDSAISKHPLFLQILIFLGSMNAHEVTSTTSTSSKYHSQ
jgi:hypothetical protein